MGRYDERQKGYYGTLVDGAKLAEIAKKIYKLQYGKTINCTMDDYLFVELKAKRYDGESKYAIICNEGVGWEEDEWGTIPVPTNIGAYNWLNGRVHITTDVIKKHLKNERVDIADFVRVFGDRLDANVSIWQSAMYVAFKPIAMKNK